MIAAGRPAIESIVGRSPRRAAEDVRNEAGGVPSATSRPMGILIPYARFLESRARRIAVAAELARRGAAGPAEMTASRELFADHARECVAGAIADGMGTTDSQ